MGEELTNAALISLIALFTLILRATGSVAAFLTGIPHPTASWAAGAGVLLNPGDPAILDASGPVVTISTRPDNLTSTRRARQRRGPVAVSIPSRRRAPGGDALVTRPGL